MARLNLLEETRYEKLPVSVYPNQYEASIVIASRIAQIIRDKQSKSENAVFGLATGATPLCVYADLVRMHKNENLSFKNVIIFNLDEYYPMNPNATQSYVTFMRKHLIDHVDIEFSNFNIPDGSLTNDAVADFCLSYEERIKNAGGIDLQILGIGRTGHIGFNEPGSAPNSGTRLVSLDDLTRSDASFDFGAKANVPTKAITMGIGTILSTKALILMAWGEKKASIIKDAIEGDITGLVPASYLQLSQNIEFVLDKAAAAKLTRFDTPWLVKDCLWNNILKKKAVIWLANVTAKPILKLTEEDYNKHGMAQLAIEQGPVYNININIFNQLQHTITGWPGGKPQTDDSQRPERALPEKKHSLIFSPHPDDDVISMGGTFIRLVDQGHDVHVAYQTSGNNAVWDDDVLRYVEFALDFKKSIGEDGDKLLALYHQMRKTFKEKQPNQKDLQEILDAKSLIRKTEAIAGARYVGLPDDKIHFMSLPFYETGSSRKNSFSEEDVRKTVELLQKVKPHQIFAAGDFADPNGTHLVCFNIILAALKLIKGKENWLKDCWLWLYRGAWHEFDVYEIEMAVPLSPQEVIHKRNAIFKHQSQKDRPVFPGDDAREFWVRAEDRNSETAYKYNRLGLAEYEAMEAFVRYHF